LGVCVGSLWIKARDDEMVGNIMILVSFAISEKFIMMGGLLLWWNL
jgi:hypothetical protein